MSVLIQPVSVDGTHMCLKNLPLSAGGQPRATDSVTESGIELFVETLQLSKALWELKAGIFRLGVQCVRDLEFRVEDLGPGFDGGETLKITQKDATGDTVIASLTASSFVGPQTFPITLTERPCGFVYQFEATKVAATDPAFFWDFSMRIIA